MSLGVIAKKTVTEILQSIEIRLKVLSFLEWHELCFKLLLPFKAVQTLSLP